MTRPLTPREKVENALYLMEDWRRASPEYLIENILTALASGSGDHAELARLADDATPGPWEATGTTVWREEAVPIPVTVCCGNGLPSGECCGNGVEDCEWDRTQGEIANAGSNDAAFIAAANPATVLALLAEIAALRAESEARAKAHAKEIAGLYDRANTAEGELDAVSSAIGTVRFMDPPDGGDVHLSEQVRRMASALTEAERKLAEADRLNDRAAELMRQCTDPERFEGASTLNVYANMRAWLSDLPPAPGAEDYV